MRADRPGGTATVGVIVPESFEDRTLRVRSVDRAGQASDATTFRFQVRPTGVRVFAPPVDRADLGETYPFWFTSDGYLTEAGTSYTPTRSSWPLVTGDRTEIRISPSYVRGVVEYRYRVNGSPEVRTVAADAGGGAVLRIDFGAHPHPSVEVWGRTADGIDTESTTRTVD
ncbi:hypothetical protein [Nocardia sp. NRRL S-836]|uniref:hypothetical protein n=1 Tax=Nocardia sp. NRRL S-836 TaxID=1519492 RepID=UPI0006AE6C15|nr:hypothetical protein [Nocardia sp. NRRL S-836]KOV89006.1 hypothetical protein ADL03_03320 [Nocardia sp. NRRL S-836]